MSKTLEIDTGDLTFIQVYAPQQGRTIDKKEVLLDR